MKRTLLLALLSGFISFISQAQRAAPDVLKTKNGMLTIQPVTHGTVVFTWNGKTLYVDPYGGAKAFAGLPAPDLILITDIHQDHLNLETLQALDISKATLVVPPAVAEQMPETFKARIVVLKNGEHTEKLGITIKAIPMYNLPEEADSRHPKGRGNGYVLELGGKKIYLSGDTEDTPEMRKLDDIDVAFVCMNLPFTMDITQAAAGVLAFKPAIVYPYHYRGQNGLSDVNTFKNLVEAGTAKTKVRLRNWYPEF